MFKRRQVLLITGLIFLLMLACTISIGGSQPQAPTTALSQQDQVNTAVAQTVGVNPPVNPTLPPAQPTQPPTPVAPTLTLPPGPTAPPTATPLPCNWAKLVSETIPDGSTINVNANFTKNWRLKNAGTCTWNTNYKAVFYSGNSMNGPATKNFTQVVHPGETMDLSMLLKAPGTPGTYTGTWHLYGDDNVDFTTYGIWVTINAVSATPPFQVSSVSVSVNPTSYIGICPKKFTFTASITVTAPGTVTYYWTRSDGSHSPLTSLVFTVPGTKNVTITWTLGAPGTHWEKIYIDNPNHQLFGPATFHLICTA